MHRRGIPITLSLAGGMALARSPLATYRVQTSFVTPQVRELDLMRLRLTQGNLARTRSVHVVRAEQRIRLRRQRGMMSLGRPLPSLTGILRLWFSWRGVTWPESPPQLPITLVAAELPHPDGLVVEMRRLSRFSPGANGSATGVDPIPAEQ